METLTLDTVVEEIAAELAERRRVRRDRRNAYMALALAILAEDDEALSESAA
jgi:hypothetical protein